MKDKLNKNKYFVGKKKLKNVKMFEEFNEAEAPEQEEDQPLEGPTIKFRRWTGILVKLKYANNDRIALELIDPKNGETIIAPSVNIPEADLEDDEVVIKEYGGNEGIKEILTKAGVIKDTGKTVNFGFIKDAPICKVLF